MPRPPGHLEVLKWLPSQQGVCRASATVTFVLMAALKFEEAAVLVGHHFSSVFPVARSIAAASKSFTHTSLTTKTNTPQAAAQGWEGWGRGW